MCTEIIDLINEVQQQEYNTSSIIITHDLTCAKNTGNRVAMLLDGKFLEESVILLKYLIQMMSRSGSFFNYNFIR